MARFGVGRGRRRGLVAGLAVFATSTTGLGAGRGQCKCRPCSVRTEVGSGRRMEGPPARDGGSELGYRPQRAVGPGIGAGVAATGS